MHLEETHLEETHAACIPTPLPHFMTDAASDDLPGDSPGAPSPGAASDASSAAMLKVLLTDTLRAYSADRAERLGAAVAYYAVFSLAPLLVLALATVRLVYGRQSMQAQAAILDQVESVVGPAGRTLVEGILQEAAVSPAQGTWAVLLGSALLIVAATAFFARLQDAMNTIWDATPAYTGVWGLLRSRLLSLLLVLAVGGGLLASLVLNAVLGGMIATLGGATGLYLLERFSTLVLLAGLCALLFRLLPDTDVAWADVWAGAIGTALLISLGTSAMAWYLGQATVASAYGAAGALAALLLWIYYVAQIFFLGAEFTSVYAAHRRSERNQTGASGLAAHGTPAANLSASDPPESAPASGRVWPARLGWVVLGALIAIFWKR